MDQAKKEGHTVKIACSHVEPVKNADYKDVIIVGTKLDYYAHNILSRLTDHEGQYSKRYTIKLIKEIDSFSPDIVHIHNIHGHWINYELLFNYLAKKKKKVIWTLHDCWAFTGHCSHYITRNCYQWKTGCEDCNSLKEYPQCYGKGDASNNYKKKKKLFTSLDCLEIVTPSKWLAGEVRQSFFNCYKVRTIYNGVDLEVFKPTDSDFREKCNLQNKTIILGVANVWSETKGLYDIIKLSGMLDSRYCVVIVGISDNELRELPDNVIGIPRTKSAQELASIYSSADVFINPSYQETMGLVTLEALACGTPAVVYNKTAVPEVIDEKSGIIVNAGDVKAMLDGINTIINNKSDYSGTIQRSRCFEKKSQYDKYISMYHDMTGL